jgi:hypothetical protein
MSESEIYQTEAVEVFPWLYGDASSSVADDSNLSETLPIKTDFTSWTQDIFGSVQSGFSSLAREVSGAYTPTFQGSGVTIGAMWAPPSILLPSLFNKKIWRSVFDAPYMGASSAGTSNYGQTWVALSVLEDYFHHALFNTATLVALQPIDGAPSNLTGLNSATADGQPKIALDYPTESKDLAEKFQALRLQWHEQRGISSSATAIVMCEAYQRIIGLGPAALPIIFAQLNSEGDRPDLWSWALRMITQQNPVPDEFRGNGKAIARFWLEWARQHGYLSG